MRSLSTIAGGILVSSVLAIGAANAQANEPKVPDERPGAGAIIERNAGTAEPGSNPRRPAGDAPDRRTGPTEDDTRTGILEDEHPGRPVPGRDMMGNEPGTSTGNQPRSDRPGEAGDALP